MNKFSKKVLGNYLNALAVIAPGTMAKHSFKIFCHPIKSRFKEHHSAFLNTAQKINFQFNKLNIQGYKWGHGPKKILFLHGWQSHSFRWKNYIKTLPLDQYTLFAFDAPGHGASDGNLMHLEMYSNLTKVFMQKYGPFEAVVTHSMGGLCILYTLFQDKNLQVDKIVLMGSPGSGQDFLNFYQKALNLSDKAIELTRKYIKFQLGKDITYYTANRFVQGISTNGLIIHDLHDQDAPYYYAESLHQNWINSILIPTNGLGHNLKSPKIVDLVCNYLQDKEYIALKDEVIYN